MRPRVPFLCGDGRGERAIGERCRRGEIGIAVARALPLWRWKGRASHACVRELLKPRRKAAAMELASVEGSAIRL